ncbi:hypothetical protein BD410DRAFT_791869 [Rickenella mellea]|uniref:F-box domain-containing protein n=1 Tax=Rickenella mellea TaxID=50990 RepID=A0A4Y7PYW0_9AGAM|nr:hypothetical protein BD410DRAFT_791869 [Rickenella mellea]
MASLATAPFDVLSAICKCLPFHDIVSLRRVCKNLQNVISTDKTLWAHVLKRDIVHRNIPLVPYRQSFELVNAPIVESWTRNAISLQKAYKSTRCLSVDQFTTDVRAITWVKLIRGRWCLFASSNALESRLSLLDISSSCDRICAEVLLSGPVMDGQIEQHNSGIVVALSVGSRERFVQIFSIGISGNIVEIVEIHRIPGADRTLFLRGSIIGVAVLDGDDSNPTLIDWKTGKLCALQPSIELTSKDEPIYSSVCLSMTVWKQFVVVAFSTEIRVYIFPPDGICAATLHRTYASPDGFQMNQAIFICNETGDGDFSEGIENALLYIFRQDRYGDMSVQILNEQGEFQLETIPCDIPPRGCGGSSRSMVLSMTAGLTGSKICLLYACPHEPEVPPGLMVASINRHMHIDNTEICSDYQVLPDANLPFLHFWPCFDFDDSRGILIIGTSRGELCISRFVPKDVMPQGSVMEELPRLTIGAKQPCLSPVALDLPIYHQLREYLHNDIVIPPLIVDDLVRHWQLPEDMSISVAGWSSDWHRFKHLRRWIMPSLRWGRLDPEFSAAGFWRYSSVNKIRFSFGFCGEPCPVMYREDDHDIVIFRIGQRPYMLLERPGQQEHFPIALFRTSLSELPHVLQDLDPGDLHRNHLVYIRDTGFCNTQEWNQLDCVAHFDYIVQYLTECADPIGFEPNPKEWTNEQWSTLNVAAREAGFKPYDFVERELTDDNEDEGYDSIRDYYEGCDYEIIGSGEFVWDTPPEEPFW